MSSSFLRGAGSAISGASDFVLGFLARLPDIASAVAFDNGPAILFIMNASFIIGRGIWQ
jgi:hypothetical protein